MFSRARWDRSPRPVCGGFVSLQHSTQGLAGQMLCSAHELWDMVGVFHVLGTKGRAMGPAYDSKQTPGATSVLTYDNYFS